jgi:hypothetical protein
MSLPPPTEESQAPTQSTNDAVRVKADYFTGSKTRPLTYKEPHEADVSLKFNDDGKTLEPHTTINVGGTTFNLGECENIQATASVGRGYVLFQKPSQGTCAVVWPVTGELEGGRQRTSNEQDGETITQGEGSGEGDNVSGGSRLSLTHGVAGVDSEQMGTFLRMS